MNRTQVFGQFLVVVAAVSWACSPAADSPAATQDVPAAAISPTTPPESELAAVPVNATGPLKPEGYTISGVAASPAKQWGAFSGPVEAVWLDDEDKSGRKMRLLSDFSYTDPAGRVWRAPKGSMVDGASIPRFFWSTIGGPFEGPYRRASVVHDVECQRRHSPWQNVHHMFYFAMLAGGVGETKAKMMYAAVYHFGPRWTETGTVIGPPTLPGCPTCAVGINPAARVAQNEAWNTLEKRIETGDLRLEDIETYSFPEPLWIEPSDPEALERLRGLIGGDPN